MTVATAQRIGRLRVPGDCLPSAAAARAASLRRLFPELDTATSLEEDHWVIDLRRPADPARYVDPGLLDGLEWWASGTSVEQVGEAVRDEGGWQLALLDSWTLPAWSRWLCDHVAASGVPERVVILHADEHDDLRSPLLLSAHDGFIDPSTGQTVDLLRPDSVAAAVRSGAISSASYIVPLLHWLPSVEFRHLCVNGNAPFQSLRIPVTPVVLEEPALGDGAVRPAARPGAHGSPVTYARMESPKAWLDGLGSDNPVLLHVDLDCFCNPFDRKTRFAGASVPTGAEAGAVLDSLSDVLASVAASPAACAVESVTVALSPGFFPAALWPEAVGRLHQHLPLVGA
jgi:hypothetical protein